MVNKKPLLLITGGAGYVGSNLVRDALNNGYRVRCLDLLIYGGRAIVGLINHPDFQLIKGDVRDKNIVENALDGVDAIVHLAAIVGDLPCQAAPKSAYQINFLGTRLLADIARKKKIGRFIFASTCSSYGITDTIVPADERRTLNPVSLYAETKVDCENYLLSLMDETFHPTCLRYGTAFGVSFRTRFDLVVNSFAYEALTKNELLVFAAKTWRPYVHVGDMCEIITLVLSKPIEMVSGEVFNAGSNSQNYTKEAIVNMFLEVIPSLKVDYPSDVDDKRDYRVDFSKLEKKLGFQPTRTVKRGIEELVFCFSNGILTAADYEGNNLEHLKKFFADQEAKLAR